MGIKRLCRCCCATRATEDKLPGGLPRWLWWTVGDFLVKDVDVECTCAYYHQITSHIKSLRRPRCRHYTFARCRTLANNLPKFSDTYDMVNGTAADCVHCLLSLFGKDQPTRPKSPQKNNNSHTLIQFSSLPAHVDMETPARSLVGNQDEYQSL